MIVWFVYFIYYSAAYYGMLVFVRIWILFHQKEEVKVEVEEGRILQISGECSKEKEEKNDKWHHVKRSSGKFLRRFWLPENAKVDQVKATMEGQGADGDRSQRGSQET